MWMSTLRPLSPRGGGGHLDPDKSSTHLFLFFISKPHPPPFFAANTKKKQKTATYENFYRQIFFSRSCQSFHPFFISYQINSFKTNKGWKRDPWHRDIYPTDKHPTRKQNSTKPGKEPFLQEKVKNYISLVCDKLLLVRTVPLLSH